MYINLHPIHSCDNECNTQQLYKLIRGEILQIRQMRNTVESKVHRVVI